MLPIQRFALNNKVPSLTQTVGQMVVFVRSVNAGFEVASIHIDNKHHSKPMQRAYLPKESLH